MALIIIRDIMNLIVTQFIICPYYFYLTILYQCFQGTQKNVDRTAGRLYVGGLNRMTEDITLRDYFSTFGEITNFFVPRDHQTKQSRGFGFITFENDGCLELVLGTQPHCIEGTEVYVKKAIAKEVKE